MIFKIFLMTLKLGPLLEFTSKPNLYLYFSSPPFIARFEVKILYICWSYRSSLDEAYLQNSCIGFRLARQNELKEKKFIESWYNSKSPSWMQHSKKVKIESKSWIRNSKSLIHCIAASSLSSNFSIADQLLCVLMYCSRLGLILNPRKCQNRSSNSTTTWGHWLCQHVSSWRCSFFHWSSTLPGFPKKTTAPFSKRLFKEFFRSKISFEYCKIDTD